MELIGNILKETTRYRYKKTTVHLQTKEVHAAIQQATLMKLMERAKMTYFGLIHKFDEAVISDSPLAFFKEHVPVTNYESFYEQWLKQSLDGAADIIWPGKIKYYALSSGTTSASSKRIPVSTDMIRQFQKTTYNQIIQLNKLNLPGSFYQTKFLILGGSTKLTKYGANHYEGDLSGILAKNKSLAFSPFSKPGKKIAQIENWNEKINRIVEKAPKWNIGVISGIPSWVLLLLERIVERYKLKSVHEIWPNLELYLHGGVFVEPYKEKLDKLFGKSVVYQNTFLASEGYFGYQRDMQADTLELLLKEGVFYEFVEERYFDQLRNHDYYEIPTLTLDQVQPNTPYAMIISTCSGLWRYNLGDVVEFTDNTSINIRIVGRLSHAMNSCGEHLSEANLVKGIEETAKILNVSVEEFCVYSSRSFDRHNWYIGANQRINSNHFAAVLNDQLCKINDDYASVRKYMLKAPKVKILPVEKFYEFMLIKDRFGAQSKFPHVMNEKQARDWEIFLTNSEQFQERYRRTGSS